MRSDIKSRIGGRSFLAAAKLVQAGQALLLIFSLRRKYSTDTNTNIAQIQIRNKYKYNVDTDTNMTQIQMRKRNLGDPEFLLVLHHVGQYGTSDEDLPNENDNVDGDDGDDDEDFDRDGNNDNDDNGDITNCDSQCLFMWEIPWERPCILKMILMMSPCLFFWVDPQFLS